MGLGKTVQTLAFLSACKDRGDLEDLALIVAPTSLVGNWAREAAVFAPGLRVLVLHGPQRATRFKQIPEYDLVITTYPLLPRDREVLAEHRYSLLILDEAQVVKNPKSQAAQVVRSLQAEQRLCLTGTPMENHLGDQKRFAQLYRTPIEKRGDSATQARLGGASHRSCCGVARTRWKRTCRPRPRSYAACRWARPRPACTSPSV